MNKKRPDDLEVIFGMDEVPEYNGSTEEWFICKACKGKCSIDSESDDDLVCQDCFDGWDMECNHEQDHREYNEMRYKESKFYANQYRN